MAQVAQPDTDVPYEEVFEWNRHNCLPSNRVDHSGGENLVLGSSTRCTSNERSSQLVTSYNTCAYVKEKRTQNFSQSTDVRNENGQSHTSGSLPLTANFSQRLYGYGTTLSNSTHSRGEENSSQNLSVQPSSITPYPQKSDVIHNETEHKRNLNSYNEPRNLPVTPHSVHAPDLSEVGKQRLTDTNASSRHQQEDCKPPHETLQYPTNCQQQQQQQKKVCHTNMETTSTASQKTYDHKASGDDIKGNPSAQSVSPHSSPRIARQNHDYLQHNTSPPVDITRRPNPQPKSIQYHDSSPDVAQQPKGKKVFILHYVTEKEGHLRQALLSLAVSLRNMKVDVSIDMFEKDKTVDNWSIWYEREILSSSVVLCIITPNFYTSLTNGEHVKGYSVYNLLNNSKGIAFRAVFLDSEKNMEHVPLSMRGATCYSIYSQYLTVNDEEFVSLYAFLTGQNRVEKPPLGNMVVLAPKRSKCKFIYKQKKLTIDFRLLQLNNLDM